MCLRPSLISAVTDRPDCKLPFSPPPVDLGGALIGDRVLRVDLHGACRRAVGGTEAGFGRPLIGHVPPGGDDLCGDLLRVRKGDSRVELEGARKIGAGGLDGVHGVAAGLEFDPGQRPPGETAVGEGIVVVRVSVDGLIERSDRLGEGRKRRQTGLVLVVGETPSCDAGVVVGVGIVGFEGDGALIGGEGAFQGRPRVQTDAHFVLGRALPGIAEFVKGQDRRGIELDRGLEVLDGAKKIRLRVASLSLVVLRGHDERAAQGAVGHRAHGIDGDGAFRGCDGVLEIGDGIVTAVVGLVGALPIEAGEAFMDIGPGRIDGDRPATRFDGAVESTVGGDAAATHELHHHGPAAAVAFVDARVGTGDIGGFLIGGAGSFEGEQGSVIVALLSEISAHLQVNVATELLGFIEPLRLGVGLLGLGQRVAEVALVERDEPLDIGGRLEPQPR